ncbi:hypothetical protein LINPERPRIM_LOCUS26081 [Linum perenne]
MAFTPIASLPTLVGVLLLFLDRLSATLKRSTSFTPTYVLRAVFIREGDLPFGGAISALIERLGIRLHGRFATGGDTLDIRPQHVLRCIGWSRFPPLNGSGGEGLDDADELAADTERRLQIWSGVDNASNYASSPEWMI